MVFKASEFQSRRISQNKLELGVHRNGSNQEQGALDEQFDKLASVFFLSIIQNHPMNKPISSLVRKSIKLGLKQCTREQVVMFKRMYSHKNPNLPIDQVLDSMNESKLDTALSQVERTVTGNAKRAKY